MAEARSKLILIAGGSGSGKTTLAEGLIGRFPAWTLVHLDDYQKRRGEVPKLGGRANWDDPAAVRFEDLVRDIQALLRGESVTLMARPQKEPSGERAPKTILPGEVILLEGYLALWHREVRELSDYSIFLDLPASLRHARRRWHKSDGYLEQVLEPMHQLHVQPTSAYANLVMSIGSSTPEAILETVIRCLKTLA